MFRYIHAQLSGYMRTSKDWKDPQHAVDRGASKIAAVLLALFGIILAAVPMLLESLPSRVALRGLVVSMLLFGLAGRYWKGISFRFVVARFFRYWLPNAILIYLYLTVGSLAIQFFKLGEVINPGKQIGPMLMVLASIAAIASWMHARIMIETSPGGSLASLDPAAKAKVFGFRIYTVLWVAFFLGGAVMLAEATWFGDWLMVDILGL